MACEERIAFYQKQKKFKALSRSTLKERRKASEGKFMKPMINERRLENI